MLNNDTWEMGDGPLHDEPAEQMFLQLQRLHNDYCVHVDIDLPAHTQAYFNDFMFARGIFSLSSDDNDVPSDPNRIAVSAHNGALYVNGQLGGALTLQRGVTYVFDQSDASNGNHPLGFKGPSGTAYTEGVTVVGTAGTPGAYVSFTIRIDTPASLSYYCKYHPGMTGGDITVPSMAVSVPVSRILQTPSEGVEITFDMACNTDYSGNPRLAFQMSLYCALAFVDQSLDTSITHKPYGVSSSCDKVMRHNSRNQLYREVMYPPDRICNQDVESDTCTMRAYVRTTEKRTCAAYCEGFDLQCESAAIDFWWGCAPRRPWSCDAPQDTESYLLCTCGPRAAQPEPAATHLTPACAKQLLPSDTSPYRFCNQDVVKDTCTVQARLTSFPIGTCAEYCDSHGLECVGAAEDNTCIATSELTCDTKSSSYQLCTCKSPAVPVEETTVTPACTSYCATQNAICVSAAVTPEENCILPNGLPCENPEDFATQLEYVCGPDVERQDLVQSMATQSCQRLAFSPNVPHQPSLFCPPHTLSPAEEDTCTVLAYLSSISPDPAGRTCNAYCRSFPGMKCAAAAEEYDNQCHVKATLACDEAYSSETSDLLCSCTVDDTAMAEVVAEADVPMSGACQTMMIRPDPYSPAKKVCQSFPEENTCTVLANVYNLPVRTCSAFCSSFPGMTCVAAAEDKWSTCNEQAVITCDTITTSNDVLCTCGFQEDAPNAAYRDIAPLFEKNAAASCPAYTTALNQENEEYYINEGQRSYTKVTLTLEVDDVTGKVSVNNINTARDNNYYDIDTYNTAHVEVCDGVESLRRDGDPDEKCSFGHRLDKSQNCYGKVYGQTFHEAHHSCATRGGHIVKIDSEEEYSVLKSIFGSQSFNIGLHDIGGRDWEWDGYPGEPVDPYTNTYAPLAASERWDCTTLDLGDDELTSLDCFSKSTWMCEGVPTADDVAHGRGGDLLADEGGFCLWYLQDPSLSLPDDESNGFSNTELAHFLQYDASQRSRKYIQLYDELYAATNIPGHPENEPNWDTLTYRNTLGIPSDEVVIDKSHSMDKFHCHFSPTNFGVGRIYAHQHMMERLYPGAMHKHCFCGYKHIGHFVTRCDCTRSGEANGNCQQHHRKLLFEETYLATGQYVYCNNGNCERASP